jgi:diamine N-acetyltransferase
MTKDAGHQTMWLGVWERNARARSFYRRQGFVAVGDHVFMLGEDAQTDIIIIMEHGARRPAPNGITIKGHFEVWLQMKPQCAYS